jgi:GNAT superfamily N-acetyltransferase
MQPGAPLRIETFSGAAIAPYVQALATLRMTVFRDWPYLYEGSRAEEEAHLAPFASDLSAAVVIAFDGADVVGASTCHLLEREAANITAPFLARGLDPARFFYFGESVLLPPYRGQGAGVAFFAAREAHARAASACDHAAFCAVVRPPDHPLRPPGAVPLDGFWRKRGFTPYPDLVCTMRWKQIDTPTETENRLAFWLKSLTGAPLP